jgi:ADP-heptose:LPS heptosyltransferase
MGYGDEIMATGMARGLAEKGKLAAFGDGRKIIFSHQSQEIFWGNPNIAYPGSERQPGLEWIKHYRGCRAYARAVGGRWVWNQDFRAVRGEVFLTRTEIYAAEPHGKDFVLIEPNVKSTAVNKQWPVDRYQALAQKLQLTHRVVQFEGKNVLRGVPVIPTGGFRDAMAILANAALYVGPEGGLHHAAEALGVAAVVIFGGFISPSTTGYADQASIFVGTKACGTIGRLCPHCVSSMRSITVARVYQEARRMMDEDRRGVLPPRRRGAPRTVLEGRAGVRRGSDVPAPQADAVHATHPELPQGRRRRRPLRPVD